MQELIIDSQYPAKEFFEAFDAATEPLCVKLPNGTSLEFPPPEEDTIEAHRADKIACRSMAKTVREKVGGFDSWIDGGYRCYTQQGNKPE